MFGDSFGEGVWAGLYNRLRTDRRFEVRQFAERSTGFTRHRSLNILDDIRPRWIGSRSTSPFPPFGANDAQGIWDGAARPRLHERAGSASSPSGSRPSSGCCASAAPRSIGSGLPRMRDARFDADIQAMNRFYGARMAALDVPMSTPSPLTVDDDGEYAPSSRRARAGPKRRMARANDGVHHDHTGLHPPDRRPRRRYPGLGRCRPGRMPMPVAPATAGGEAARRRFAGLMAIWLGPIAVLAGQAGAPAPCRAILCQAGGAGAVLRGRWKRASAAARCIFIQLGDSHTAGDMISRPGGWRLPAALTARWRTRRAGGRASRIRLPHMGRHRPPEQRLARSIPASVGAYSPGGPPLGLSGFTQTAQAARRVAGA